MNRLTKIIVYNTVSFVIVIGVLLNLLWTFLKNPRKKFWKVKPRTECPEILQEKSFGEHKYVQLKDIKLHYVENGPKEKELLLFLHGFPEFWFSWRHQIREFSKDYWTVAIDLRGYGDSEKKEDVQSYQMEYLVEDVRNVITALGREKCTLVAHDWGGVVAHTFIRKYPEMLNKYILINTAYSGIFSNAVLSNREQFFKSWYMFLIRVRELPELLMTIDDFKMFDLMLGKLKASPEEVEAYKYNFRTYDHRRGPLNYYRANFLRASKGNKGPIPADGLNALKVPGLYIHGNDDPALTVDVCYTRSFADIENVKYINIPNQAHFVHISSPQQVNELMREFLFS